MSNINLYSVNHLSKLLSRYKDDITDSGGVIAYSFFIYDSRVDDVIKKYAMQYIYNIYILIFDEIIGKIAFPFSEWSELTEEDKTLIILYDTNFLSLEEQEFIDNFLNILNINENIDEINPENEVIKHIYENCFTLIQEYLHYEYNVTVSNMGNTAPASHILTRGMKKYSIAKIQLILDYMLIELLQKTLPTRNITNKYKELICLAITLCNIILVKQDINIKNSAFWTTLMKDKDTIVNYYIEQILTNLTSLKNIEELLIQIQHIMNSCLQSINIAGNSRRLLSIKTIMNALGTIGDYFITLFHIGTDDVMKFMDSFDEFTEKLLNVLTTKYVSNDSAYDYEPIFLLCRMDIIEDENDINNIKQLISSKTLYINFIDEIITLISLLTTSYDIDVTHIKDKLNHIILTNKIFRSRETISNKIEIFTNECKENIKNFELNYLSVATKFNSISNYNRQLKLEHKPPPSSSSSTDTLVSGSPMLYSLHGDFIPKFANITNTCGLNEKPTLTYINPSYENLFC